MVLLLKMTESIENRGLYRTYILMNGIMKKGAFIYYRTYSRKHIVLQEV